MCGLSTVREGFPQAVEAVSFLVDGFAVGRFVVLHRNKLWDSFLFPFRWYFASETEQAGLRG